MEKQKEDLIKQVDETEEEVIKKAEELKEMIECHKQLLLHELGIKKRNAVKHLEKLNKEVKQHTSFMEVVKVYTEEVSKNGTTGDIARDSDVLRSRTDDLVKLELIERARNNVDCLVIKFTPSTLLSTGLSNVVGEIDFKGT